MSTYRMKGPVEAYKLDKPYAVHTHAEASQGAVGDYVVVDDRGERRIMSATRFEALYEEVPEAAPEEDVKTSAKGRSK